MEKNIKVGDIVWTVQKNIAGELHIRPGKVYRVEFYKNLAGNELYPVYYYKTRYSQDSDCGENIYLELDELKQYLLKSLDKAIEEAKKLDVQF